MASLAASPLALAQKVKLTTNMGDIVLELDAQKSPKTVENFLQYIKSGFYKGTIFHRVINGFMIQGGGMTADMTEKTTRPPIPLESRNGLSNTRGTVAMARTSDPNSATAQFFINVGDNVRLDAANAADGNGYAVFGKVVSGMEVVDQIRLLLTTTKGPHQNVPMQTVTITEAVGAAVKQLLLRGLTAALVACLAPVPALANAPSAGLAEVQELAKAGRSAEALRRVDALIAKYPQDPHLRFQKGVLLVDQKRSAEAIALFERMGREYPTLPEPLNNLAVLYAEQGQIEKARAALESAMRSRPSYDTAYQNLSSVNVRMASRAYARALQIDDSNGAPKLALLKSLNGSQQDGPATVAAAPPAPLPSPAPASPPPASAAAPVTPAKPPPVAPADPPPKPEGTEPSSAAASANPATVNGTQRRATDEAREVNAAVRAWAAAWERKDMNAYFAAYEPGFRGNEGSASAWQAGRRLRILGKSKISLELTGLTVEMLPNNVAKASFRQDYVADRLKASSPKVLELVKRNGRWLVRKESVGS